MSRSYTITQDKAIWRDAMECGATPYYFAARFGKDHKGHLLVEWWPRDDCPPEVEEAGKVITEALAGSQVDVRLFHVTGYRDTATFTVGFMAHKPWQEGCPPEAIVVKKEEYRFGLDLSVPGLPVLRKYAGDIFMASLTRDAQEKGVLLYGLPMKTIIFGEAKEAVREFVAAEMRSVGLPPPPEPGDVVVHEPTEEERAEGRITASMAIPASSLLHTILSDFQGCSHWPPSESTFECRSECLFRAACEAAHLFGENLP